MMFLTKQRSEYRDESFGVDSIKSFGLGLLSARYIQRVENDADLPRLKILLESADASLYGPSFHVANVVLFTNKATSSQLYKAVSAHFFQRLGFVEVATQKAPSIAKAFNVDRFPTLLLFPKGVAKPLVYDGPLTVDALIAFLQPHAISKSKKEQLRHRDESQAIQSEMKRLASPVYPIETSEEWAREVVLRQTITGVLFIDDNDEAGQAAVKEVARVLEHKASRGAVANFVSVDSKVNAELVRHILDATNGDPTQPGPMLVFISSKKQSFSRFVGALAYDSITSYIRTSLARGVGAKSYDPQTLPTFHPSTRTTH